VVELKLTLANSPKKRAIDRLDNIPCVGVPSYGRRQVPVSLGRQPIDKSLKNHGCCFVVPHPYSG
jgi:hypothetical protein